MDFLSGEVPVLSSSCICKIPAYRIMWRFVDGRCFLCRGEGMDVDCGCCRASVFIGGGIDFAEKENATPLYAFYRFFRGDFVGLYFIMTRRAFELLPKNAYNINVLEISSLFLSKIYHPFVFNC